MKNLKLLVLILAISTTFAQAMTEDNAPMPKVFLGTVENKISENIHVRIGINDDSNRIAIVLPSGLSTINRPLQIRQSDTAYLDGVKDNLQGVFFVYAYENIEQPTKFRAILNTSINKTTNTLEADLGRKDTEGNWQVPSIEKQLALGNAKEFYINVVLEGDDFEKSQISISNITRPKSLKTHALKYIANKIKSGEISREEGLAKTPYDLREDLMNLLEEKQ